MPIEFNCPHCSTVLRTPDASAGKKARCPQCANVTDVPMTTDSTSQAAGELDRTSVDGPARSAASQQVSQSPFGDGMAAKPAGKPVDPKNPYAAPTLDESASQYSSLPPEDAAREGLPWERGEKSIKTFWETSKLILGNPTTAFQMVRREGSMLPAMLYALAGGFVGAMFSAVYGSIMQVVLFGFMMTQVGDGPELAAGAGMLVFQIVLQFVMGVSAGTVGVLIGTFVSSAIYHVFLMMLRGANYPFEATFVVVAYVTGATALIQVIPLCGQYVYGIVALVYAIIGLSAVQRISGGKAAAAVLLPGAICIALIGLVVAGAIAAAVGAAGGAF